MPFRRTTVLLFLLALPAPCVAQRDDAPVLAAVRRLDSARAGRDRAALEALLAPGYRHGLSGGVVEDRAAALALAADTAYRVAGERSELAVARVGGAAVVTSRWQGRGRHRQVGFVNDQRCTLSLVEARRAWQVTSEQCTQIDRAGTTAARPADVASLDAIIAALYDVISGPAGQKRDFDRMRSLFAPGARLIPSGRRPDGSAFQLVWTVDQYITASGAVLEKDGFFEREIGRQAHRYGDIVQVFSAYDSRHTAADAQPFARGINSIQARFDGTRWWINTVFWEAETPANPIPAEFLAGAR